MDWVLDPLPEETVPGLEKPDDPDEVEPDELEPDELEPEDPDEPDERDVEDVRDDESSSPDRPDLLARSESSDRVFVPAPGAEPLEVLGVVGTVAAA